MKIELCQPLYNGGEQVSSEKLDCPPDAPLYSPPR